MDSLRQLMSQWDRLLAIVLTVLGGVFIFLGYIGVSRHGLTAEQMPYISSGGLGGIFLMGVGAALWLSADLRDEWRKLDRIETLLETGLDGLGLGRGPGGTPTLQPLSDPADPSGATASIDDTAPYRTDAADLMHR